MSTICILCKRDIKDQIKGLEEIAEECRRRIGEYSLSLDHEQSTLNETLKDISESKEVL